MLLDLANDSKYHIGKDIDNGLDWHARIDENGYQQWVNHYNGTIRDGEINKIPRKFDPETGLNYNVKNTSEWRKKQWIKKLHISRCTEL